MQLYEVLYSSSRLILVLNVLFAVPGVKLETMPEIDTFEV
ncbi:hypothetical protein GL2_33740 [Microbulbifer sp. GL-2]|nr:hypothetical protein GL2_33740 [Microbulbifer sp. GL-2]